MFPYGSTMTFVVSKAKTASWVCVSNCAHDHMNGARTRAKTTLTMAARACGGFLFSAAEWTKSCGEQRLSRRPPKNPLYYKRGLAGLCLQASPQRAWLCFFAWQQTYAW